MEIKSKQGLGRWDWVKRDTLWPTIRRLVEEGYSDREVARRCGVSSRTVLRHRQRHGIANFYNR